MPLAAPNVVRMYAAFYGLEEEPFNITPDPRFLYLNNTYQEALAALGYGIQARKGFLSLIGEAGTGKTTLLRHLLDTLDPSVRTVLLMNPTVSFDEILEYILMELGIPTEATGKLGRFHRLNEFLIEHARAGGNVALLIDEAQDLDTGVLEQLRLLSNLETSREKILQILFAGQPELETKFANPALRQLRQRITLRVRLRPLTPGEVAPYVHTRLERAGATDLALFADAALERVGALSHGIPRVINVLCDAALLTAFATGAKQVTPTVIDEVWRDYAPAIGPDSQPPVVAIPTAAAMARMIEPPPPAAPTPLKVVAPAEPAVAVQETPPAVAEPLPVQAPPPPPAPAPPLLEVPATASVPAAASASPPAVSNPAPAPDALPASPLAHQAFSIPAAAACVAALAVALYAVSPSGKEVDPLPPAAPSRVVASNNASEAIAVTPEVRPVRAEGLLSTEEAATVVEQFRTAYEARDVERLVDLFAPDAAENGTRGIDAIAAGYRRMFTAIEELSYTLESLSIAPRGVAAEVRGPFIIRYRESGGDQREVRGQAEWEVRAARAGRSSPPSPTGWTRSRRRAPARARRARPRSPAAASRRPVRAAGGARDGLPAGCRGRGAR